MLNIFVYLNFSPKLNRLCKLLKALVIYSFIGLVTLPAYASQELYTLTINQNIVQPGAGLDSSTGPIGSIDLDSATIANLKPGVLIDVPIPGGKIAKGKVVNLANKLSASASAAASSSSQKTIISLENNAGSVEIEYINNSIKNIFLHDVIDAKIYTADINTNGNGVLTLQDNNDYYCVRYPDTALLSPIAQQAPQIAELIPSVSTLRNLQSRPGSSKVLFIDYWGGSINGTAWNVNFNSNNPINYTAYDRDGNPGNFTSTERYSMWLAWREAVEDFAPFNINITTSRAVYNAAAVNNRSQMVVTTTSSWYGNAGGVAYVDVFDDNSDYYKVGWTWNLSDSSMGMTISHEAGHQLGLSHDGIGTQGYYSGHGVWGPIMGAPFGQRYVQWSKGEYPGANEAEDDIAIITTKLGRVSDDAGNSYGNATNLNLPVNNKKGLVGFQDIDAYKFTLNSAGSVEINVIPLLGDEDESRAANLSMEVSLVKINASGGVIANVKTIRSSDNSPLSPLTNEFTYSASNVSSGTYALRIRPTSPDTSWTTGFGNYANAGEYRFSVSASTSGDVKTLGRPSINRSTDTGIFIWESSTNNWQMNVVSGNAQRTIDVDVISQQTLSNIVPVSIESSDVFTQTSKTIDMRLNLKAPWMDGVKFRIANQSSTCVSTSNTGVPIFVGPDRVQMPNGVDLSTLQACDVSPPPIDTFGKPSINRSTDAGVFMWRSSNNTWVMNVVSGNAQRTVVVNVASQKTLSGVSPISIESSDVFTQLPMGLNMRLNLKAPWMDGARFTVKNQSSTCVTSPNSNVPIYIGRNRVNVGNAINLETLSSCQ